jgi:hypothetical protein
MKNYSLLFAVLLVCLIFVLVKTEPAHNRQLKELEKRHQNALDSITKVYKDSLHKRELAALKVFNEAMRKVDRLEGEVSHWKGKYNHEKNNHRTFSDADLDSLLAEVE